MIFLIENNMRGGVSSVMSYRYVESDDNKKILYIDANNFSLLSVYGHSTSQPLPIDEIKIGKNVKLEGI